MVVIFGIMNIQTITYFACASPESPECHLKVKKYEVGQPEDMTPPFISSSSTNDHPD